MRDTFATGRRRRISAVYARSNQHVVGLNVGVRRHITQIERASVPPTEDDGAQAVPHNLHRGSLLLVSDQGHLGKQRMHPRHLADHADVIDDCLAGLDTLLAALIDDDRARKGIATLIENLRQG
jgi:hypothetical protein